VRAQRSHNFLEQVFLNWIAFLFIMEYDLELERAAGLISSEKAKKVCIQLPDGLKPKAEKSLIFSRRRQRQTSMFGQAHASGPATLLLCRMILTSSSNGP